MVSEQTVWILRADIEGYKESVRVTSTQPPRHLIDDFVKGEVHDGLIRLAETNHESCAT